ncbi:MAG: HNH endonuclease [Candidatus Roizmanbacteria bacterium]|nr:HNH endonuclease [Candidatus Roizmanbacteria bacterium]
MKDKRTYRDRAAYIIKAVTKRRKKLKKMAVDYLGGQCIFCGYNKLDDALEFHHIDATKKDFGLAKRGLTRSWEKIKQELNKCVLVCANCHREIHTGIVQLSAEMLIEKQGEFRET